ncbi:MAG: hypothetical protein AAF600_11010 [Bacteroidota bacterium]
MKHFIVYYYAEFSSKSGDKGTDTRWSHYIQDEVYPNSTDTVKEIKERWGFWNVRITGIQEVTMEEAEQYFKGRE